MKKITLAITLIALVGGGCIFSPTNMCNITIETESPKWSYSFDCSREEYDKHINNLLLNKPDVMEGNVITLGECDLKTAYEDNRLKIYLEQKNGGGRKWGKDNPCTLKIAQWRYEKLMESMGVEGDIAINGVSIKLVAQ